jgi:hypothetical protein
MGTKSDFLMWGERGLVATFFHDLWTGETHGAFKLFLSRVEFLKRLRFVDSDPTSVTYLIEPDFSNTGFGHPDAIILADYDTGSRAVFIVEAKRVEYSKASASPSQRDAPGYNSTINGQLELDFCLAMSLSMFREGQDCLCEPAWVPQSPYGQERKGRLRCLKKRIVLNEVAEKIAGLPLENYFYITITHDQNNPFTSDPTTSLPEIYKPSLSGINVTYKNCWDEMQSQFGWINYTRIRALIDGITNSSSAPSLFAASYELNRANMGVVDDDKEGIESDNDGNPPPEPRSKRSKKGSSLVYVPEINRQTFLHFSWQKNSCAFRDYSKTADHEPAPQYKTVSKVEPLIQKEIGIAGRHNRHDVAFWQRKTQEFNDRYLKT